MVRLRSCWQVVCRHRVLVTLLGAIAAAASFALSMRFPPLYEAALTIDVAADIGPLPPEFLHPGSSRPTVSTMAHSYYARLDVRRSWMSAKQVAKQLEAQYGWRVVGPGGSDVDGLLIQEIQDSLSSTKRGERGLTIRLRNHNPWRAQQFAAAVRDLLHDDGARYFAGGPAVRSVRVTVLDSLDTLPEVRAPSTGRRVLQVLQQATMALAVAVGTILFLQELVGIARMISPSRRTSSIPAHL